MPYNSIIGRTDTIVPVEVSNEIFNGITEESAVLRLARRLPNMTSGMLTLPVLNSLPYAYFVNGDTGLKQTSAAAWTGKNIVAEEIAVIVPVPEAVLADSAFDIWTQINPLVRQAFGRTIDAAILYGTNKPSSWPAGIVSAATTALNTVEYDPTASYDSIMGENGLIALVEEDGYGVTGYIGAMQARGLLRGIKDQGGMPIFRAGMTDGTDYRLDGAPIYFPRNGAVDATSGLLIAGDFNQLVYAIRQDLTVKRLDQAVITDGDGAVVYNLPQQDMVALRFVMRLGWQLPNPVNAINSTNATRYPFAVLLPEGE